MRLILNELFVFISNIHLISNKLFLWSQAHNLEEIVRPRSNRSFDRILKIYVRMRIYTRTRAYMHMYIRICMCNTCDTREYRHI